MIIYRKKLLSIFLSLYIAFFSCYSNLFASYQRLEKYSLLDGPQFIDTNQIKNTPFSLNENLQFYYRMGTYIAMPVFGATIGSIPVSPIGMIGFGISENTGATQNLRNFKNVNKLSKGFTTDKCIHLAKYIDKEGISLFWSYLRGRQTIKTTNGKIYQLKILNKDDQIKNNITPYHLRELTRLFLINYKKSNEINSNKYLLKTSEHINEMETAIDSFLREFGFIVFKDETLQKLSHFFQLDYEKSETKLLNYLQVNNILTSNYKLRDFQNLRKTISVNAKLIKKYLSRLGVKSKRLQKLILHDIGFPHPDDLIKISNNPELIKLMNDLKEMEKNQLSLNLNRILNKKLNEYIDEEPKLDRTLDEIILESIIKKDDIRQYLENHKIQINSDKDDLSIILRLIFLEQNSQNENFYTLDQKLIKIKALILKNLDELEIENRHYKIIKINNEQVLYSTLLYISRTGFITEGSYQLANTLFSSSFHQSLIINLGLFATSMVTLSGITATIASLIDAKEDITRYISLKSSEKVLELLQNHLSHYIDSTLKDQKQIDYIKIENFKTKSLQLINSYQKNFYLNKSANSLLWALSGSVVSGVGTVNILTTIGILTASHATGVGIAADIFFILTFFGFISFYVSDHTLNNMITKYSNISEIYYKRLMNLNHQGELTQKQKNYLLLFESHSEKMLKLSFLKNNLFNKRMQLLNNESKRAIISHLEEIKRDQKKIKKVIDKFFRKTVNNPKKIEENYEEIREIMNELNNLLSEYPSYKIGYFDHFSFEIINDSCPIPKSSFLDMNQKELKERHIRKLFASSAAIVSRFTKTKEQYLFLYEKDKKLKKHFNQRVKLNEVTKTLEKAQKRYKKIKFCYRTYVQKYKLKIIGSLENSRNKIERLEKELDNFLLYQSQIIQSYRQVVF